MRRLAVQTLRHRPASLFATVAAVAVGAALAVACASLFETAIRLDAPPQRLAGADVVIAGAEHAVLAAGDGKPAQSVALEERPPLPDGVADTVAGVSGVARAEPVAGLDAVAVHARSGADVDNLADAIRDRLSGRPVTVLIGDDRGRAEATGVAGARLKLILLAAVSGGMVLVVMGILLMSIVGLSIEQRRRELALLSTIGATPRQIRRMVVAQTMIPSAIAAVVGAALGRAIADSLFNRIRGAGIAPDVVALHHGVLPIVAGTLAALAIVRVSAGIAARRAGSEPRADALGDVESVPGEVGPLRRVLAAVALAGAASCAVMTVFMPPANAAATGGGTALAGAIACALLAPRLVDRLARRLAPTAARYGGVPSTLGVDNVLARTRRVAPLVTPVILLVAIALANVYQQTTQAGAMRSAYLENLKADAVVTGPADPAADPAAVRAIAGVASVSGLETSKGWIEQPVDTSHRIDPWPLLGADAPAIAAKVAEGSLADLQGETVALPQDVADDLDLGVGDRVGLVLGDGAHVKLRVAALLDGSSRYGTIVLPSALLAAHTSAQEQLLVQAEPGTDHLRDRLAAALPGHEVRDADALADDFDGGLQVDAWITFAVVIVIVAYAAMSLVNSMVAALAGRRRELALLGLIGATRHQVRRMLDTEALVIGAIGTGLGTVVAIAGLIPLAIATAGTPIPSGPVWVFAAVVAIVAALVLVPTRVVLGTTLRHGKVSDVEAL